MKENEKKKGKIIKYIDVSYIKIIITMIILTLVFIFILWETQGGKYENYYLALASLLGGLIGGIGTLIAVIISNEETRRIQEENKKMHEEDIKRQELADSLTCIPMLDVNYDENLTCGKNENLKIEKTLYNDSQKNTSELCITGWILLDNIGQGPCNVKKQRIQYTYMNENESITKWSDDEEDKNIKVESTEIITTNRNRLYQISVLDNNVSKDCKVSSIMVLELFYDDLLGNEYTQKFTLFCDNKITKINSVIVELPQRTDKKMIRN